MTTTSAGKSAGVTTTTTTTPTTAKRPPELLFPSHFLPFRIDGGVENYCQKKNRFPISLFVITLPPPQKL